MLTNANKGKTGNEDSGKRYLGQRFAEYPISTIKDSPGISYSPQYIQDSQQR